MYDLSILNTCELYCHNYPVAVWQTFRLLRVRVESVFEREMKDKIFQFENRICASKGAVRNEMKIDEFLIGQDSKTAF